MHYAITYVSTAAKDLNKPEIDKLLKNSEHYNNKEGFTGILLFSEGNFFQVIEGEKEKVLHLYKLIKSDERHNNIIQIFGKEIQKESYDGYESDFVSEEARYDSSKFHEYVKHLKVLDQSTQMAVQNMLKAFMTL